MHSGTINQPVSATLRLEYLLSRLRFSWREVSRTVFRVVFALCFLLSGVLSMASILWLPFNYRMALAALFVVPLLGRYGIRATSVALSYALLVIIVLVSGLLNHSSLSDIGLFLRVPFFSFLIYRLVQIVLDPQLTLRVLRFCVPLAIVQLPILLLERLAYPHLPAAIRNEVAPVDFDFGTFNFKGDPAMVFFLLMLLIFLLFNPKSSLVTRRRGFLAIWATLTVLLANSEIAKLAAAMVWGVYFATKLNRKSTLRLLVGVLIFLLVFVWSGRAQSVIDSLGVTVSGTIQQLGGSPGAVERYLSGEYSRGGAIYYYLHNDLLWYGDGPSRYTNPINRERLRGNVGHIFTFYSEVGLLGWATSMLIFALIVFHRRGLRIQKGLQPFLMLGVLMIFGFTAHIMNDIGIMLAYCIFANTHMLSGYPPLPKARPRAMLSAAKPQAQVT